MDLALKVSRMTGQSASRKHNVSIRGVTHTPAQAYISAIVFFPALKQAITLLAAWTLADTLGSILSISWTAFAGAENSITIPTATDKQYTMRVIVHSYL
jgi:hypothetical protein